MIYLLPYEPYGSGYYRKQFGTGKIIATIHITTDKKWEWSCRVMAPVIHGFRSNVEHNSFESASVELDSKLIEIGYYLVSENEVERFKEKLIVLQ